MQTGGDRGSHPLILVRNIRQIANEVPNNAAQICLGTAWLGGVLLGGVGGRCDWVIICA